MPYKSLKVWQETDYPVSPFLALPYILPKVLFTLQRHANTRGYFSPERFNGRIDNAAVHELALNPDSFIGRTDEEILSTLVHEMAHVWQQAHGKAPRRSYHDRQWAGKM